LKSTPKKLTGILFILLAFTPLLFFVITEIKQRAIQHKMKEQLETKLLQVVVVAENNIHWIKKGKEILINGRMFDIKSISNGSHGKIVFSGLYDEEETNLVNAVQKKQQHENSKGVKLLTHLFQLLQEIPGNPSEEFSKLSIPSNNNFPKNDQRLITQFSTILTPPPQT
jgi:hypothetical protein